MSGSVSGKLTDGSGAPVAYANVTLLRADSSVANGDLSKDDGSFRISPVGEGSYTIRIESIGFTSKYVAVPVTAAKPDVKMGAIKLTAVATELNAVNVTAEKKVMELKVDKKVFNVEKNTTTAGGSATDVLQNVPAISVDMDGNVSLRGKGNVTVLIDGKPATMMGTDITSALQSLPASSIESVEVITNPSAKYDAQGTTGIINIITKKDGRLGINGNVTVGAGTRDKYNANLGLNVRKGKWNTFLNSSFRQNNTFNNVTTDRQDTGLHGDSYYTYEHVPRLFGGFFNTLGTTYDLDKNNSFTLTGNVNTMQWGFRDNSDYYVYDEPGREGGSMKMYRNRYSEGLGGPLSFSGALDYKHKFKKKGEEMNIDATYASSTIQRSQIYDTKLDTNGKILGIRSEAPGRGGNNSFNAWADYVNPITETGKLGAGMKSQFYEFYSSNDPLIWNTDSADIKRIDYTQLTKYNYKQQIHAAYVNWSDQKGKLAYQLGLRIEDAQYNGTGEVPTKQTFKNSFLNLFPSAFVSYQLTQEHSVYLNYSRRTNRPGFFQMMPFKDLSNPGTVSMGNPDILPEFIDNIEANYSYSDDKGNTLIFSAYFANTSNLSERILKPITGDALDVDLGLQNEVGQLLSRPMNIASGVTYGLEGTAKLQFTKIWDATLSANLFNNQLNIGELPDGYSAYISNTSGYGWFSKVNTSIKLPANFSLQFNGNYESPKVITQGRQRESYWLDVALRKNLWKNKATLIVNCSDVFKTRQFINNYNTPLYTQTIDRVKETRIGNLTFTYRFGKQDMGNKGMGPGGDKGRGAKRAESRKAEKPTEQDRANNLKQNDDSDNGGGGGGNGGGQRRGQ
ncbi:outer membrane beta-barrel family protein [Nemorincola caseinilytica]|uniref:Outer membrane beta-barrel family protein n=1 Tax=Nemorincola caseinilytica TaxID=2054315 RepID=A0ABP8N2T3_9BACT